MSTPINAGTLNYNRTPPHPPPVDANGNPVLGTFTQQQIRARAARPMTTQTRRATQTRRSRPMTVPDTSTVTVNGRNITTRAMKKIKSDSGVWFPKSYLKNLNDKAKLDFLKQVELKQQIQFTATTLSVNDGSKLINNFSLTKTISECKRNMYKYGLHEVFTIVKPYDIDGPDAGQLKSDTTTGIFASDLFDRYHSLTVEDVLQSCR